ncbi:MAG: imidazoleglycerol-phosphate dehydratase HisB [Chloroflexi bacterium]|nr:imidazoleglycerol-phosphate dehydratase HisB [Chloroflexota bacterium]
MRQPPRRADVTRTTRETHVRVMVDVDGTGRAQIRTGLAFYDHMLTQLAVHGLLDLTVEAQGDLEIDPHHTWEDVALTLGQALDQALGSRVGLVRMGYAYAPLDEALARVVVDLSGRPYAHVDAHWHTPYLGRDAIPVTLVAHFFRSLAVTARLTVHAHVLYGEDDHHQVEALFKALARALHMATRIDPARAGHVPSSKGVL